MGWFDPRPGGANQGHPRVASGTGETGPEFSEITREEFAALKREVDGLQVHVLHADRPWYRQASVLIAVAALLFSGATTWYANARSSDEADLDRRTELGLLIQRLSALPAENARASAEFPDDPRTRSILLSHNRSETLALALQAADLIDAIPELVSPNEYLSVAQALVTAGVFDRALGLIEIGLQSATEVTNAISLWRLKGNVEFLVGEHSEARRSMREALAANDGSQADWQDDPYTEYLWSTYEEGVGNCEEAVAHLEEANKAATQMPSGQLRDTILGLIGVLRAPGGVCP